MANGAKQDWNIMNPGPEMFQRSFCADHAGAATKAHQFPLLARSFSREAKSKPFTECYSLYSLSNALIPACNIFNFIPEKITRPRMNLLTGYFAQCLIES
jgi:hypothetical protein